MIRLYNLCQQMRWATEPFSSHGFWTRILNKYIQTEVNLSNRKARLSSHHINFRLRWAQIKNSLRPPSSTDRGDTWWVREASSHQRNVGMLPRFPSRSRSLLRKQSRIWGMRESCEEPPNCHCARIPLLSLLFSQRAKRENACATMPPLLHLS